jgi:pimeloyl-ACP methyl ester carboxylesterase
MKRFIVCEIVFLQLLYAVVATCQPSGNSTPPPLGKLVDAGGHVLHLNVSGNGAPAVIFENGTNDFSIVWSLVQPEVSKLTQTVSYDRAGYAWSEPGPLPRTSRQMAFELYTALKNTGIKGPYILVGQSFGGFLVRAFARYYPDDVAGMILVDVLNEDSKVNMGGGKRMRIREFAKGLVSPEPQIIPDRNKIVKDDTILLNTTIDPPLDKLPKNIQAIQIWAQSQKKTSKAVQQEMEWSPEDVADMYANRGMKEYMLGNMPLIVISRGSGGYEGPDAEALEKERVALQEDLTRLSSNSKHIIAKNSGHNVHVSHPEIVIEAIKEILQAAKKKQNLK